MKLLLEGGLDGPPCHLWIRATELDQPLPHRFAHFGRMPVPLILQRRNPFSTHALEQSVRCCAARLYSRLPCGFLPGLPVLHPGDHLCFRSTACLPIHESLR